MSTSADKTLDRAREAAVAYAEDGLRTGRVQENTPKLWSGCCFEWCTSGGTKWRVAELNGLPVVEEWMDNRWITVRLPADADPVLHGIAQLAKRLRKAEQHVSVLQACAAGETLRGYSNSAK